ncbi:HAMP domain-containing sensor histidine kinase [Paenibacillus qinlingensis]|uniref:histidine kinase n=1 Tax=Paenibacillus qinlingensis TaxID=1837343 RepID=A0ABU1NRX9_9BACL|nr:HAMP domain-containing sensor histidine kinase [Paenibacillus qinlingensis]MDR6550242.1 signal transduction histidine kinase [Paenibacillus qinlingensis]
MKFWQKTYLLVLIVFLIVFDLGAYGLLKKSYQLNEKMDISRGFNEYEGFENALSYILNVYTQSTGGADYGSVIGGFAANYYKKGIQAEVYNGNQLIFSNAYQFDGKREELQGDSRKSTYRNIQGQLWIFVGGKMDFQEFRLVISRNSDYLQANYQTLLHYFITLSVVISVLLSVVLILLLFQLTSPIRRLNKGVKDIAAGAYHKRVKVTGNDEIGELAQNFNKMVDAVSTNIATIQTANEEKQTFINNLTHEIKTPITAIKGYSEFLTHANYDEDDRRMAIGYILEHANRLDLLSKKMMELLYLKNGDICMERVDVNDLFTYVVTMVQHQLEVKQITVDTECLADHIAGDKTLLQTLFINLVENSVKASHPGGKITLKSSYRERDVIVEVLDCGKGIPEKDIAQLTEAFYVVDKSRTRELGGIGLGLSICSQIAELHHARIQITSKENEFTKVSIDFTTP